MQKLEGRILIVLLLVLILRVTLSPIASSLWLDETATMWTISGGFGEIAHRSAIFSQSILYSSIALLIVKTFGINEIALRIPSALAFVGTLAMIYQLGRKMFSPLAGVLAAIAFITLPGIAFTAADARPYSLGLLAMVLGMYGFYIWLMERRTLGLVMWVVATSLAIYFSFFFGVPLLAQVLYLSIHLVTQGPFSFPKLIVPPTLIAVLCLPLAPQLLQLLSDRGLHSYAERPWLDDLSATLAPSLLVFPLVLAFCFARFQRRPVTDSGIDRKAILLLILWAAVPPLVIAAVSSIAASVYLNRYLYSCTPAIALLAGAALSTIQFSTARITAALCMFVFAFTTRGLGYHLRVPHNRDWRGALAEVRAIRGDSPVFISSWFIEIQKVSKPDMPYLLAPVAAYSAGGPVKALPFSPNKLNAEYMENCAREMEASRRFLIVSLPGQPTLFWLAGRLPQHHMHAEDERIEPSVFVFERKP